ncbi:MAG: GMC family oxidoreductase [Actinomycetales bacterium]
MEHDVLVVGAGAAGCAVAARLACEGSVRVLLVEAGYRVHHPAQRIPKAFLTAMLNPRLAYHYPTESGETWIRGRALGGSTTINGMMWVRGDPGDYDRLAALGNPGWGWAHLGPVYADLEAGAPGARRGLRTTVRTTHDPIAAAILTGAADLQVPPVADLNATTGPRIGFTPSTIDHGLRVDATSLLPSASPTLQVLTGAKVGYLLLENTADGVRATGVRALHRGRIRDLRAQEVVLAGGTIESALLLERSGIGRPEILAAAGVRTVVPSPRVGEGVVEQRSVTLKARVRDAVGLGPRLATRSARARELARYLLTRSGAVAGGAYEISAMLALASPGLVDTQLLATTLATDDTGLTVAGHPGLMLQGYLIRPGTDSSVHLSGPHPDDPPRIRDRYLATDGDREAAARILNWHRRLLSTRSLADLGAHEVSPGPGVRDVPQVARYVQDSGNGIFHAVGSCAMGPDEEDVVDAALRVRGVHGLRVADASVLPFPVAGGTAAPAMAVGHRAAEILLEQRFARPGRP